MKKRLNILCLLVIMVLGYSVFNSIYQLGVITVTSYESARKTIVNDADKHVELKKISNIQPVAVIPDAFPIFSDSVLNEKTGEHVPAYYSQLIVSVDTKAGLWQKVTAKITAFVYLLTILLAVYLFLRLIISMNKSVIFDWRNVRRLRWLGISLILCFVCEVISICITSYALSDVFSMKGYSIHFSELVSITNLVLGISALIVGEVFAIGLRMKEEQELTI